MNLCANSLFASEGPCSPRPAVFVKTPGTRGSIQRESTKSSIQPTPVLSCCLG